MEKYGKDVCKKLLHFEKKNEWEKLEIVIDTAKAIEYLD